MNGWPTRPLGEIATNFDSRRVPLSSREREKRKGPYPYYGATGIMDYIDDYLFDGLYVLIAEDGSVERENGTPFVQLVKGKFWVNNHAHVLKAATDTDTKFLYYALSTIQIRLYLTGSVQPKLNQTNLNRIPIPFPPESYRQAIVYILGTLDDKIELNRRMNETLEEIAKAIFKSWFVDFAPVIDNALKAGNPIPDALAEKAARRRAISTPKLSPEIARLFPDSFEDSPLGPVPQGWRVKRVSDLGKVVCGKTPPTKDKTNYGKEVPFITIPDMHGKVFVVQTTKYLSKKGADLQSNKYLPPYSICVSCIATPGLVVMTSEISQTNQQINSVIPYKEISPFFAFLTLKILGKEIMQIGSGGSVFTNLSKSRFENLNILMPPNNLIKIFHEHIASLFLSILNNEKEILNLANIRDTLLPKLISGQIRIKDAEKFVEEVL